jgi:tRNA A37 threonylcarbamoyladenosine modification protein TsaB
MARTISQQLNLPLFGISSLAAIAHRQGDPIVAVQMPAQRGELHTAIYQRHDRELQALYPDTVRSPQDWQALLAQQPATLVQADAAQGDYAQSVLALAYQRWHRGERSDWAEVLPFYGQHPVTKYRHGDSIRPD